MSQLTREYQSHSGSVNTAATLHVDYTYRTLAQGSRLTALTYPNGRVVTYNYGTTGSLDDTLGRLTSLSDSSGILESYTYLGLSTVVQRANPAATLTYLSADHAATSDSADPYVGFDRFGRILCQRWVNSATGADVDVYSYTYDRDSNRLTKNNLVYDAAASQTVGEGDLDEAYTYDDLNRLATTTRGGVAYQSWNLVYFTVILRPESR